MPILPFLCGWSCIQTLVSHPILASSQSKLGVCDRRSSIRLPGMPAHPEGSGSPNSCVFLVLLVIEHQAFSLQPGSKAEATPSPMGRDRTNPFCPVLCLLLLCGPKLYSHPGLTKLWGRSRSPSLFLRSASSPATVPWADASPAAENARLQPAQVRIDVQPLVSAISKRVALVGLLAWVSPSFLPFHPPPSTTATKSPGSISL